MPCSAASRGRTCSGTSRRTRDETFPGIPVLRLDGGLFFATAEALERPERELDRRARAVRALVLDLEGVDFVDSQGAAKLAEVDEAAAAAGVVLRLARIKPQVGSLLESDGVLDRIGPDRIHGNVQRAVRPARERGAVDDGAAAGAATGGR